MKQITGPSIAFLDERFVNVEDWFLMPPADDWFDPTGGLPVDPDDGDRYISEETANGWTQDYIYEWNELDDEWIESVPEEGWMIWMLFSLIFYVFFSGGWMEVGNNTFLRLDATNDPVTGAIQFQNATDSTTAFQILDADGGVPVFNVDTVNERVAIGTATPGYDFHLLGPTQTRLEVESSDTIAYVGMTASTSAARFGLDGNVFFASDTQGKDFRIFVTPTGGSLTQALRIEQSGRVRIGSTSGAPASKLFVQGSEDTQQLILLANSTQTNATVQHQTSNADVHNEFFVAHASNLYTTVFNKQSSPLLDFKVLSDTKDAIHVDASEDLLKIAVNTKIGDGGTTNYTEIESDGTIQAFGTATAFDDIRVPLSSIKRLGFADPSWVQFADDGAASIGVYALSFSNTVDQEVYFSIQIPHNWKLGSDLDAHVHWSPSDTSTNSVTWKLEYTVANINGTFGNTSTLSVTDAGDGTAKKHQYADLGDIDLSAYTANTDVSIMVMCRLYRDVSDGDDYAAGAFLLEADFHYEIDTLGSRTELTK